MVAVLLVHVSLSDSQSCLGLGMVPNTVTPLTHTLRTNCEIQQGQTKAHNLWQWCRLGSGCLRGMSPEGTLAVLVDTEMSLCQESWQLEWPTATGAVLTEHGQKIRDRFISLHLALIRLHLKHASSIVPPSKTPNTDQLEWFWKVHQDHQCWSACVWGEAEGDGFVQTGEDRAPGETYREVIWEVESGFS